MEKEKQKKVDFSSPTLWMSVATVGMGIYAGGHFMKIGVFLGCAMALGILILLSKSPGFVKRWTADNPFAADIIFSGAATMMCSGFFGTGLSLGIGAVTCGLFLSWCLPVATKKYAFA